MTAAQAAIVITRHRDILTEIYRRIAKPEVDERLTLVLAHVVRAQQIGNACLHLASGVFVEEIHGLSRTLSEVATNAAYLQIAEPLEVQRFIHFEASHLVRKTKRVSAHNLSRQEHPPELLKAVEQMASQSKQITGRGDKDRVWSKYCGLEERAKQVDTHLTKEFGSRPMLQLLVASEAVFGDAAIHATIQSMQWFINGLTRTNHQPDERRMKDLGLAMHGLAFGLSIMCHSLNLLFSLGMEKQIAQADVAPPT